MADDLDTPPGLRGDGSALIDAVGDHRYAGAEFDACVGAATDGLAAAPDGAVFLAAAVRLDLVLTYLACWDAGRPVAMLDPARPDFAALVTRFRPALVVPPPGAVPPEGYRSTGNGPVADCWVRDDGRAAPTHPDLGLLLATSGSTGSPRLVRLSRAAVRHNARAIATVLSLGPAEVAPTSLPLHYSFGLSVLHSHLAAGATVLLTDATLVDRGFWTQVERYGVTSLSGVPRSFQILDRLRLRPNRYPSLRTLNQAGGRLAPDAVSRYDAMMREVGGRLHVMWGQTEAAPRMTTLPPQHTADKPGSVGLPLPGGRLSILLPDGSETCAADVTGEVVYRGPNVMMGYADDADDLARGDVIGGILRTGDLGQLDGDGFLWLTGRISRIAKVFGVRVNLDELEAFADEPVAAVAGDDRIVVFQAQAGSDDGAPLAAQLARRLRVHPSGVQVRQLPELPLLPSGKIDYAGLRGLL